MAASAVHYYFPSRRSLLEALIVDGFHSLADALESSDRRARSMTPDERWLTVCRTHRRWALYHPAEYLLLFGHTGWRSQPLPAPRAAMARVLNVLFLLMRDAVAHGDVDVARLESRLSPHLRQQLSAWRISAETLEDLPEGALAACMIGFAQLHGAITLELIGLVPAQLSDRDSLFDFRIAHIAASLR